MAGCYVYVLPMDSVVIMRGYILVLALVRVCSIDMGTPYVLLLVTLMWMLLLFLFCIWCMCIRRGWPTVGLVRQVLMSPPSGLASGSVGLSGMILRIVIGFSVTARPLMGDVISAANVCMFVFLMSSIS